MANSAQPNMTYAITGIPCSQDVEVKTKDTEHIPFVINMPTRKEISDLYFSTDPLEEKQWSLFILALTSFKMMSVDQKLSYFQVAGIHGYPQTSWDGADAPPSDPDPAYVQKHPGARPYGGYCHHNSISFPTWHRPYMLLFEQLLWEHMIEIISDWKLDTAEDEIWRDAANKWRLPYWDWARRQHYEKNVDFNGKFAMPEAFTLEELSIRLPVTAQNSKEPPLSPVPNPLYGFENPEKETSGAPRMFQDMPDTKKRWALRDNDWDPTMHYPWGQCRGVSRYGITKDAKGNYDGLGGVNAWSQTNRSLDKFAAQWYNPYNDELRALHPEWKADYRPPGTLADAINRLFTDEYSDTWGLFASTKWWKESAQDTSTGYLSLEYIHNNVHNITGGGSLGTGLGHMCDVPVAAFDPIFWLHHCNIDRLTAMWQCLNWKTWFPLVKSRPEDGHVPDTEVADFLKPFHNVQQADGNTGFWTSADARDWTRYGYQYDTLVPKPGVIGPDGHLDEQLYRSDLKAYIHDTYPNTLHFINALKSDASIRNEAFFGENNAKENTWNDYVLNVIYDRYALDGISYTIQFWLGGRDNDPDSTFMYPENMIGEVYSLGGMRPASEQLTPGCANCGAQKGGKVLSRAQVPITIPIIVQALASGYKHIKSLRGSDVIPYLTNHLHWQFVQLGGIVRPADDFPDTTVSVLRGTGKPSESSARDRDLPPKYGNYEIQYQATEEKEGGVKRDDEMLGEGHTHFRLLPGTKRRT